jgi:glycosyltransferase involved in cell wall biosynthesis
LFSGTPKAAARRLREAVRAHRADVVHFHNTFPLMSPAAYYAARAEGAAVVQTLHNFRLLCPGANLFRDGRVCETCLGRSVPLAGVKHKCYRDSTLATAATAGMLTAHRMIGTWQSAVDAYITPTAFAREKFIAGGLPAERIHVKPNFVDPDPGAAPGPEEDQGGYAILVARLSHEKGLDVLLPAWDLLAREGNAPRLKIVGDGPLADDVKAAVARHASIEWLGRRGMDEVFDLIGRARRRVFPSACYETGGRTAVEAFARGTPVIASGHGAPGEVVADGRTGLLFKPGDANDLAAVVRAALADPARLRAMGAEGRREYEAKYTGARNYDMLMSIYEKARAGRACRGPSSMAVPAMSSISHGRDAHSTEQQPRTCS